MELVLPLRSKLFRNDRLLEACLVEDKAHVLLGAVGDHVAKLQTALSLVDGSKIDAADRAGKRYGRSTAAAVLTFKTKRSIINRAYQTKPDDIVGKLTIAALDHEMFALENRPENDYHEVCCNGDPADLGLRYAVAHHFERFAKHQALSAGDFHARNPRTFFGAKTVGSPPLSLFSNFKRLSAPQIAVATPVFGTSIDFTLVFLSEFKGMSGRAFTVASGPFIVMNCGTFSPPDETLIHELVHVWQSQHHSEAGQFMRNSVASQALAVTENKALALVDPTLKTNLNFPSLFPRSPYACITGRPFSEYAAEQIAKQVEHNFRAGAGTPIAVATDPIVVHIKSATGIDGDNVTGLKTARTEDTRTSGVL